MMRPGAAEIECLVRMALNEDAPWGDITSQAMLPASAQVTAALVAREAGVLCGEDLFTAAMRLTDSTIRVVMRVHDGESFQPGTLLASVKGSAQSVLQAERVALNFVQRMSGIATMTARYVAAVGNTRTRIADTRKTTPGLRAIERYAVRCGGGSNHRYSLSDAVMAKDNHLAVLKAAGISLAESVRAARAKLPHTTHFEIEVDRLDQIATALAAGADTILLDNFSLADMRTGVAQIAGRALVEASGGVTLERVAEIAATGVDVISVGALTHSVRALDLGLDIEANPGTV
jgi:nicotinate-nucleotide pyrophosphorylase (carboxylating)